MLALAECFYWTRKLQGRFFAGDYAAAVDASQRAHRLLWTSPSQLETADFRFYGALAHAASWRSSSSPADRQSHLEALTDHHRQLEIWARHGPANFESRVALVAAELARIEGRLLDAEELYETAIRSAHANGFVHNQAVANECAAHFFTARGFETIARAYRREALCCYRDWGADGKVRQLERQYPHLREERERADPTRTALTPIEPLDLATVTRVLQAVSGEIVLEKLLATIMRIALEHAGAARGLLILPRDHGHRIEAVAETGGDGVTVDLRPAPVTAMDLPESAFHYVVRSKEPVLLHDAAAEFSYSADPYIRQHRARSVLCLPLLKQTRLVGVLYLENHLTSGVFTPARLALLELLASEAAISLENTQLYRDLQEREARVRRLVDSNLIGIVIWHAGGRVIDTNEAFLRIIGHDRDDLLEGRVRWSDLTPPEWRDHDIPTRAGMKEVQAREREFLRKDGSRVPVLVGAATFDPSSEESVAFVVDLTDRKRAEQAAHDSERRYHDVQMRLADANRADSIGQLSASIAHEINQPLAGIITNASTCLRMLAADPPQVNGAATTARRTIRDANRASEVITRLRALFARKEIATALVDLNDAAREVVALSVTELRRNRVILRSELADDLPAVTGDRIQLQQVIVNLVRNASDAMTGVDDRPRQLVIRTGLADGDRVRLSVLDTGAGLDPQRLDNLFEAFYTTKPDGMGIGLSVSRSIVERHHGRLWGGTQ